MDSFLDDSVRIRFKWKTVEVIQVVLRGILRLIGAVFVVKAFLIHAFYLKLRHRRDRRLQREAYAKNIHFYCKLISRTFDLRIVVKGQPVNDSNFLYVGNHMGFVDIFVISSLIPALFITSQEMRETPVLGAICEMGGCIFVERRSRTRIMNELESLIEAMKEGFNVVLYPEATSSNGEQVLPFKKTLMMSAPHAGRPIQPGVVNYIEINGEEFSLKTRDHVCWYGDMTFVEAMWKSVTAKSITAEVEFLEPIYAEPHMDRGLLAERAYSAVKSKFRPAISVTASEVYGVAEES